VASWIQSERRRWTRSVPSVVVVARVPRHCPGTPPAVSISRILRAPARFGALAPTLLFVALGFGDPRATRAQSGSDEILVLAAASLTDVLPQVAEAWRRAGGATVRFSFDATSRLAPQAVQGAPADVFFSADEAWMTWLENRGGVVPGTERRFLGNSLVVVVPEGAPAPAGPADLSEVRRLALAGENVPAGRYAREALEATGVWQDVASHVVRGGSVRGALEWVARGEAGAGIVYGTDALAEPRVSTAFTFPESTHTPVRYPAAVLTSSSHRTLARAFLDFAGGPEARAIFEKAGFLVESGPPPPATPPPAASTPDPVSAIRISVLVALLATFSGLPVAVGLGWLMARRSFRGKVLLSTIILAPLVMPPVVTGFLLLSALGSRSPLGRLLSTLGVPVPFTILGAALAALAVGLPLYVLTVRNAFEAVDPHYEELSWTLGVGPRRTFLRISLPLAVPGIVAGAVLAFARALGEFGATVVLAGNVEGRTRTIALAIYTLLEAPAARRDTWILVGASVAISLAALVGYEALSRRQRRRLEVHDGR
jgi:molybdate transport system permease protein